MESGGETGAGTQATNTLVRTLGFHQQPLGSFLREQIPDPITCTLDQRLQSLLVGGKLPADLVVT